MHDLIVYIATFLASLVTLLAGFGLGTILTPLFAVVFEVKLAILLVAIVHFLNNAFKLVLFRHSIDISIVKRFGILSILGAILGAVLQLYIQSGALKIFLGIVLIGLGGAEFAPEGARVRLPRKIDLMGGFLSGFLGGMVGNQGAIRSAYLLNYGISKEAFIATATIIALLIDVTRIPVYLFSDREYLSTIPSSVIVVVFIAFAGTLIGKRFLKHVSSAAFKKVVAGCVLLVGIAFVTGLL